MKEGKPKAESHEREPVTSFETAKGSLYTYLPNGKISRYKAATKEEIEPSNVVAFIPPWETIQKIAPPDFLEKFGGEGDLEQEMLNFVQDEEGKHKVYIVDSNGHKIDSQEDLLATDQAFAAFAFDGKTDFIIPVTKEARVGYTPLDTTKYKDGTQLKRRTHIGNKVVKINRGEQ